MPRSQTEVITAPQDGSPGTRLYIYARRWHTLRRMGLVPEMQPRPARRPVSVKHSIREARDKGQVGFRTERNPAPQELTLEF